MTLIVVKDCDCCGDEFKPYSGAGFSHALTYIYCMKCIDAGCCHSIECQKGSDNGFR